MIDDSGPGLFPFSKELSALKTVNFIDSPLISSSDIFFL